MTKASITPPKIAAMAAAGLALLAAGCGKLGRLEQPAPLYGEHARVKYEAQKERAADAKAAKGSKTGTAAADQPDDAPLTTRDIKAPEQKTVPASQAPLDGVPNPRGNSLSPTSPG